MVPGAGAKQIQREEAELQQFHILVKIALHCFGIQRHHGKLYLVRAEKCLDLAGDRRHPHVGAGISCAVIAHKQDLQLLPRFPFFLFSGESGQRCYR